MTDKLVMPGEATLLPLPANRCNHPHCPDCGEPVVRHEYRLDECTVCAWCGNIDEVGDAAPETIPAWAIRVAHDGDRWIVLADDHRQSRHIGPCDTNKRSDGRYGVYAVRGFKRCICGGPMVFIGNMNAESNWPRYLGDSLEEAKAAYAELERKLLAGELK